MRVIDASDKSESPKETDGPGPSQLDIEKATVGLAKANIDRGTNTPVSVIDVSPHSSHNFLEFFESNDALFFLDANSVEADILDAPRLGVPFANRRPCRVEPASANAGESEKKVQRFS